MNRLLLLTIGVGLLHSALPSNHYSQDAGPPVQGGDKGHCRQQASTQAAMNDCAAEDLKRADAELNAVYQRVLSKFANDATRVATIKRAERTWIAFRDAELAALFPENSGQGSDYRMCYAIHRARLTTERTKELQALLQPEEGDVCAPR